MLNLVKIAVTGGVASGKTAVCEFLQQLGACVVNADAIAHELLDSQTDLGQQVIRTFGSDILQNGKISRTGIAAKVFKDPQRLKELEDILHPSILKRIKERYLDARQKGIYKAFVVEIPLLFEIGAESFYDVIIAVIAEDEKACLRFQSKGFTEEEYKRRMSRQLLPTIKSAKANYTIKNNGTLETLRQEVKSLSERIFIHES